MTAVGQSPASDPADVADRLRLVRTEGVGPITYRRLLRRFGSPAAAIEALPRLARADASAVGSGRNRAQVPSRSAAEDEIARVRRLGGDVLFVDLPGYPHLLALLENAPAVLSVLGDPAPLHVRAVALVGARNASANGKRLAELLAAELGLSGLVVVSGLARGIDAAAHEGALRTGRTVAAIAGGLDQPYPPENVPLQERIAAEGGCVVSEAPLGTVPRDRHFPRRNRIIAGLSLGIVVVEAAPRSGSLITATAAQDAGREVFAVPGSPLDPRCRGSNDLIRQGAHLVESAADVLEHLPDHPAVPDQLQFRPRRAPSPAAAPAVDPTPDPAVSSDLDGIRQTVAGMLGPSPTPVDDLVRRCQLPAAAVMAVLLELELAGRIEALPGNRVCLLTDPLPTPPLA